MAHRFRRLSALLSGLALAGGAALSSTAVSTPEVGDGTVTADDLTPVFASTCIGYCHYPTNAAKVFRWGLEDWRYEWEDRTTQNEGAAWQSTTESLVNQQQGMMTIRARPTTRTIKVWPNDQAASYGRWETRMRAVDLTKGAQPYTYTWELVPVNAEEACGGRGIVLAQYKPGDEKVRGWVRTADIEFRFGRETDLRSRAWHTYAIEVTKDHISWFSDTKVLRTERRPAALTGVKLRPQFRIEGPTDVDLNDSWMQMDWVRYYTLNRPNAQSIEAPHMNKEPYDGSCPTR
jgi:hypothetical protein